jgi:hypothetical protein
MNSPTIDEVAKRALAEKILGGVLDKDKFMLVCDRHKRAYGSKKPPNFKCKMCAMVEFVGLICNTPPEKREETVAALEHFTQELLRSEAKGEIDLRELLKHPKVSIEKDAI